MGNSCGLCRIDWMLAQVSLLLHPLVCIANDLQEWKDFPKGLRVLLLDDDTTSAVEIRSKLEEMDYIG